MKYFKDVGMNQDYAEDDFMQINKHVQEEVMKGLLEI